MNPPLYDSKIHKKGTKELDWANKMAQLVKHFLLTILSSLSGTHVKVKGENQVHKVDSNLHVCVHHVTHALVCHTHNNNSSTSSSSSSNSSSSRLNKTKILKIKKWLLYGSWDFQRSY